MTVTGLVRRPDAARQAFDSADRDCHLVADPSNEYDPNAINVFVAGHHVGFVPSADTDAIHPHFASPPAPIQAHVLEFKRSKASKRSKQDFKYELTIRPLIHQDDDDDDGDDDDGGEEDDDDGGEDTPPTSYATLCRAPS